jgi:hypothetical protein
MNLQFEGVAAVDHLSRWLVSGQFFHYTIEHALRIISILSSFCGSQAHTLERIACVVFSATEQLLSELCQIQIAILCAQTNHEFHVAVDGV